VQDVPGCTKREAEMQGLGEEEREGGREGWMTWSLEDCLI
jgi:hypothetical protein